MTLIIIQRMYDCIIVDRFFTRIFDVCYFIDKKIVYPENINNKVAIIFSNGIDTYLKYGDKWINHLKNKINFCFFFNKSNKLTNENREILLKIWKQFEECTKFPVIEFNLEEVNSPIFKLYKYENLLKKLKDETLLKKKDILLPIYFESSPFKIEEYDKEYKIINNCYIQDIKVFVKLKNVEKSNEKVILPSFNILNYYEIPIPEAELDYNVDSFLKEFNENLPNITQHQIDDIFPLNKPTLYAPSTKGTKLNISGLLNFFMTHGQEAKIWLEKKERLKRDYRITVIVDSSKSCFNKDSFYFSFNILYSLLNIISSSKIPYFDLIIATNKNPVVLCSGQDSNILKNKTILWKTLISFLYGTKRKEYNDNCCNLLDAVYLTLKIKAQQNVKKFICFIMTDGIFDEKYKKELKNLCSYCEYLQMNIFGIGIGLYGEGITDIFSKCLWSPDINYFTNALASLIKNEEIYSSDFNLKNENTQKEIALNNEINETITQLVLKPNHYCENSELYNYLDSREVYIEALKEIMNKDPLCENLSSKNPINNTDSSMFKKGFFKGLKILICCFWSKSIAPELERDEIDIKYLKEPFNKKKSCLADVISYYGIEKEDIIIVSDYENGIKHMCTGKYYATWIICGNGEGKLPNDGNANLVGQFVNCTKRYWKKGGSLVWWCDNEPFVYEFNLFMNNIYSEFPGETLNNFKFGGYNKGGTLMVAGDIDKNPIQRFNNQRYFKLGNFGEPIDNSKYTIPALGHGLAKIAIGTTVSYAQNRDNNTPLKNPEKVAPFIPFAFDDEGCMTVLFYISPLDSERGNIVVDGGFSKLFTELETEGTSKYIQNIIGFTSLYHKHLEKEKNENWMENFSLQPFEQKIDYNELYDGFIRKMITKEYDIIYMIDATGSMLDWINASADRCLNLSEELQKTYPHFDFYFGGIFYRDPIDAINDKHEVFDLTKDIQELKINFGKIKADGGGDEPEDWVGAYSKAINNINWKDGTKLIIHFADSPAHTKEFCGEDNHEEENGKLQKILKSCCEKNIKIIAIPIRNIAQRSFTKCEEYYSEYRGFYKILQFDEIKTNKISEYFSDLVKEATQCAAPKETEIWG